MGATPAAASADAPAAPAPAVSSPAVPAGAASAGTPDAIATVASASAPTAAAAPPLFFTDTHCHIHDRATYDFALRRHLSDSKKFRRQNAVAQTAEFERRRAFYEPAQLATRAAAAGVHRLVCIGTDPARCYRMPWRPMGMPSPSVRCAALFRTGTHCGVCFIVSRSVATKKLIHPGERFIASPTTPPRLSMTV